MWYTITINIYNYTPFGIYFTYISERGIFMKRIFLILIICLLFTGCSRMVKDLDEIREAKSIDENITQLETTSEENNKEETNPYEQIMKDFEVEYFAKDVEYDMANKSGRFLIEGIGELSNYYNYGYKSGEEYFFCVKVEPLFDTAKETWYLYFHRGLNKDLYNKLVQDGSTQIIAVGELNKDNYQEGQNCQAFGLVSIYE